MTAAYDVTEYNDVDEYLDILLRPIGDNRIGEDPRYGNYFDCVKSEIDRLSGTDYIEVINKSRLILQTEAKDLRIAGYYLLAMVFSHGLNGLQHGVRCFSKLLQNYGEKIHPLRETAKKQSIGWLNNEKLVAFVNKIEINSDEEKKQVALIKLEIDELNNTLINIHGDDVSIWRSLNPWLSKHQFEKEIHVELKNKKNVIDIKESYIEDTITSELKFNRACENILTYLEKNREWVKKIAISRAIKWSALQLPYHQEMVTKIPAPRQEVVLAVSNQNNSEKLENLLEKFESFFIESGCQFYFDLQKRELEEAKKNKRLDIAQVIQDQMAILIKQLPGLLELSFVDGTPFANQATRHWLKSLNANTNTNTDDKSKKTQTSINIETQIGQILYNESGIELSELIVQLDDVTVANENDKFLIDLAKIDACLASGRDDLALPLANYLNKIIDKYKLDEWNKSLALETWSKLIKILSSKNNKTESEATRIEELKEKICGIDMEFAVNRM